MDIGFYISAAGIVTFKNAADIYDTIINHVPLDRLLVETDAPYLAPTPKRGKENKPEYLKYTADFIAEARKIDKAVLYQATTDNFFTLFNKAKDLI